MRTVRRRALVAGTVAIVAVAGAVTVTSVRHDAGRPHADACTRRADLTARMAGPFDFGPTRVDVLGDSYSAGAQLARPRSQTWDVLLARSLRWDLHVRGINGTGFVNPGGCGDDRYQARVAQVLADRPELVVVEGGLNDTGRPGVRAAAARLLASFPPSLPVVVIGPPPAPSRAARANRAVDTALRGAVGTTPNRRYLSTIDWQLPYLTGGVHLTAAGHREFAARLAHLLAARPG